jgi:hypothetical protein
MYVTIKKIWRNNSATELRSTALQAQVDLSILKILKAQQPQHEEEATNDDIKGKRSSSQYDTLFDDLTADTDEDRHREAAARRSSLANAGINIEVQLVAPIISASKQSQRSQNMWEDDDFDPVVAIGLNIAIVIGVVVTSLLVIQTITSEKKDKLLGRMRIMGMNESAYWVTWFFTYVGLAIFAALLIRMYYFLTPSFHSSCSLGSIPFP